MRIGERLALAVRATGQSLRDFSALVDVPYRTLQDYVGGQREPRADILAQICTRSRVSPGWLLLGEGEKLRASAGRVGASPGDGADGPPLDAGESVSLEVRDDPTAPARTSDGAPDSRLAHRIGALRGLLEQLDPGHSDAILAAALARATDAQRLAELEQAVSKIAKPRPKKRA